MPIKIIATDLDGTLMMPDHLTVSDKNKKALFKAHNKGVKIAISTGRTLSIIENVIEQIPFVDYVLYSDGSSVFDVKKNELIFKNHISPDTTAEIIDFFNTLPIFYNVYLDGKIFTQKGKERNYSYGLLPDKFVKAYADNTKICEDLKSEIKGKSAELLVAFSISENDNDRVNEFLRQEQLKLSVTSAMKSEIEVTADTATKGLALSFLCRELGIDKNETMAIGDSGNDSTMLSFADYSFAMANGDETCKSVARFETLSNTDDGVAVAVEKYVL